MREHFAQQWVYTIRGWILWLIWLFHKHANLCRGVVTYYKCRWIVVSASPLSAEDQRVLIFNYSPTYLLSKHFNKTPPVLNAVGGGKQQKCCCNSKESWSVTHNGFGCCSIFSLFLVFIGEDRDPYWLPSMSKCYFLIRVLVWLIAYLWRAPTLLISASRRASHHRHFHAQHSCFIFHWVSLYIAAFC